MLVELTGNTDFAEVITDDTELTATGIDSGDLVRLILLIEQRVGVEVTAEDMHDLSTIADYERLVAERAGTRTAAGGQA